MSELPKQFIPHGVEEKWRRAWQEGRYFEADACSAREPFSMVIPPPNVTSRLHIGHALGRTLEDVITRRKRMQGFETLWVPGTDHAGIATQTVVEKHLIRTEGKRRADYGREEFLNRIWAWREEHGAAIMNQMERIGCSYDTSRTAFTMDDARSRAVMRVFKKLYDDGLIYRGNYICNWDPVTQTALADDEVEYTDQDGHLWYMKYPFEDEPNRFAIVATTRPETMLGDTAVAVNPKDERFKGLVGRHVILPLVNRRIPVIADDFVDPEFGTGMVKITPAHDPNDFQAGLRHDLPQVNVMHPDARINANGGPYEGLDRYQARERVVADLTNQGLIERVEKYRNRIGKSYRSGAVIEPYLSLQWFVKIRPLAEMAARAVREGEVRLVPKDWESTYFHWMDNVRDWCISRQLVWGHRIPVFYDRENPDRMVCTEGEPPEEPGDWEQDPDVLDTWFSSWLWPFSTLGWPEESEDLSKFYPTTTLVTGYDILFFWVARMVMAGYYCLGARPFRDVVLHGLVYGKSFYREQEGEIHYVLGEERRRYEEGEPTPPDVKMRWEKMSKSKGNVMDPNELIDEVGADALRFTLSILTSQGRRQIDLDRGRIIGYRNFMNKLWNAARFTLMNVADLPPNELRAPRKIAAAAPEDRWILSRLARTTQDADRALEDYHFDRAAETLYHFIWDEFCDWYLELVKPRLHTKGGDGAATGQRHAAQRVLVTVLDHVARLLHPLCPFITEEIWHTLKETFGEKAAELYPAFAAPALCVAEWPAAGEATGLIDEDAERRLATLQEVVVAIRNIRGEMNVPPSMAVDVSIESEDAQALESLRALAPLLSAAVRVDGLTIASTPPDAVKAAGLVSVAVAGPFRISIPMPASMREAERARLEKERERLEKERERLEKKLGNERFVAKAPEDVVQKERDRLAATSAELDVVKEKLYSFN